MCCPLYGTQRIEGVHTILRRQSRYRKKPKSTLWRRHTSTKRGMPSDRKVGINQQSSGDRNLRLGGKREETAFGAGGAWWVI